MSTIHPTASQEIDKAFENFTGFQRDYCNHLRALIHKALPDVKEDWKWGMANFNINGMVCGVWGFKKHVTLNFFKGSLMADKYNFFNNDTEENESNRTIHFTEYTAIDDEKITEYLKEAAALNKPGVKAERKPAMVDIPDELIRALSKHSGLKMYFDKLAPSVRREYASYIDDAAQAEVKTQRVKKVIEMIVENRKMKEKYELKNKYKKR